MKIGRRTYTKKDAVNVVEIQAFIEELRCRLEEEVGHWVGSFGIKKAISNTIDRFQKELALLK